jgi:hypothetical protein
MPEKKIEDSTKTTILNFLCSDRIFEDVCDEDLKSLYPVLIIICMIDPSNQFFRILIRDNDETPNHSVYGDLVDWQSYQFINDYLLKDLMKLGSNWFDLPSKEEWLKYFLEEDIDV